MKTVTAGELLEMDFGVEVWKRHDGLTRQRHEELGAALYEMRNQLVKLYVEVGNAFPRQDDDAKKVLHALTRARVELDVARCHLEDLYARQHPATWQMSTYYPGGLEEGLDKEPSLGG